MHRRQNGGFAGAGLYQRQGGIQCVVGQFCRGFDAVNLCRGLDQAQTGDQRGCIHQIAKRLQLVVQFSTVGPGQSMGIIFDPDPASKQVHVVQQVFQFHCRISVDPIRPDGNVLDDGCMACLTQICRTRQKMHGTIGFDDQRLKEAEAECVVSRQPIHALLCKQQHGIEFAVMHGVEQTAHSPIVFFPIKMLGHVVLHRQC